MSFFKQSKLLVFALFISLFWSACTKSNDVSDAVKLTRDYDNEVVLSWHTLFLDIDRYAPGYRPTVSSRALAYINLAAYEAAVEGMPDNNSIGSTFPGLDLPSIEANKDYHWPTAVNAAYGKMFLSMMPHVQQSDLFRMAELETRLNDKYTDEVPADVFNRSADFGKAVADAVLAYEATDVVGHQAYLNPQPNTSFPLTNQYTTHTWQPTVSKGLTPYWGDVRPFAAKPQNLSGGVPPIEFSEDPSSKFYQQAFEVYNETNDAKANPGGTPYWIAWFWADDIYKFTFEPAARQVAIANQLADKEDFNLEVSLEMYAKLSMALCDGGIVTWSEKYRYGIERPDTYIRRVIDPTWTPLLNDPISGINGVSPPFPAYPSGHSTFGPAAGLIFSSFVGEYYTFTDNCHIDRTDFRGTPRTFTTWSQMGIENAISRIPLGVHYRMDCDEGVRIGLEQAGNVLSMPWKK